MRQINYISNAQWPGQQQPQPCCVVLQVHTQSRRMLELHAPIAIVDTGHAAWTVLYANPAWLSAAGEPCCLRRIILCGVQHHTQMSHVISHDA